MRNDNPMRWWMWVAYFLANWRHPILAFRQRNDWGIEPPDLYDPAYERECRARLAWYEAGERARWPETQDPYLPDGVSQRHIDHAYGWEQGS